MNSTIVSRTIAGKAIAGSAESAGSQNSSPRDASTEDRSRLLAQWNNTATEYPRHLCIHQVFEQEAARRPEAVAVRFENEALTYRELNERANQLAHRLRDLGVGPEAMVGTVMERSLEMVIALLGILKAGGAFVPLDMNYPAERLAFMASDTRRRCWSCRSRLGSGFPAKAGCRRSSWRWTAIRTRSLGRARKPS